MRIIIFLDVDCFEVQIWLQELQPDLIGKDVPIVVVNHDGIILSVNYTAKSIGIERGVGRKSLHNARSQCKMNGLELIEILAGERFGKVDSFLPQVESDNILNVVQNYLTPLTQSFPGITLERSCRDEFFIDITELILSYRHQNQNRNNLQNGNQNQNRNNNSYSFRIPSYSNLFELTKARKQHPNEYHRGTPVTILETDNEDPIFCCDLLDRIQSANPRNFADQEELALTNGAIIAQQIVQIIKRDTGFDVSAGIASSKLLAKLACSRYKPEGITIIAHSSYQRLQQEIPFQSLPGFGSNTGTKIRNYYEQVTDTEISTIDQLLWASNEGEEFEDVMKVLDISDSENRARSLYDLCFFRDESPVNSSVHSKTFSTSMSFKGYHSWTDFEFKIRQLTTDMRERIFYNITKGRMAFELVVKAEVGGGCGSDGNPGDFNNKISIGRKGLSFKAITEFVFYYIKQNKLMHSDILKMYLTARTIVENED